MEANTNARSVNALVGQFYRSALSVPLAEFRENLLHDVNELVPFDAALWGTGEHGAPRFHSLTLLGLEERFVKKLEHTRDINPLYHRLLEQTDSPVVIADIMGDDTFYASGFYKKACRPFHVERVMGISCRDPRNRIYNLMALFRSDRSKVFTADERRITQHLTFHMMNAVSLAYTVYLSQISSEQGGSGAAICDQHGICYDSQPSFVSLLGQQYPDWQGHRLPFAVPSETRTAETQVQGLCISSENVGDLVCVRARKHGPMDALTKRELEVVNSVCRGLSYKEVARPLGIAPSTVSNHIYRVFEKLGVTSRTELAKLFNKSQHLH